MLKIIFLDYDGVINSQAWFQSQNIILGRPVQTLHEKLDPAAVNRINQITDATDAVIVLSSTWRMGFQNDLDKLKSFMKEVGFTGEVVGMTPILNHFRGGEISRWLIDNDINNKSKFIIIDDSADMGNLLHRLIRTNLLVGIQDKHVKIAIRMLNE